MFVSETESFFDLDRNPQMVTDNSPAKVADFPKATQSVYHTRELLSQVTVQVLP